MKVTRRQFLGFVGALAASQGAGAKILNIGGDKGPFVVAAMNDLHFLDARSAGLVNKAVQKINDTPDLRFTVVIGDLATDGKLRELELAKQSLARLQKPHFVVPGNHDISPGSQNPYANFEKAFGKPCWKHEEGDWLFIGLDSCEGGKSDVTVAADRIEWLKKQVKGIKATRPIALFAHHPFAPHTKQYRVLNADEVLAVFSGLSLKLVASGHYHGNQEEEQNGTLFTTTACLAAARPNFDDTTAKGYRVFRFDGAKVTTTFEAVEP